MFPNTKQYISDYNPWLISSFQSQLLDDCYVVKNYLDVEYWRSVKDIDFKTLTPIERANRFAICLYTAWGNRWKTKIDGSMGNENPINKKFLNPEHLKKQLLSFFSTNWLNKNDTIIHADWKKPLENVKSGDLVYIDPPYPESLGYGTQIWSFSDQLDIVDWVAYAITHDINVVVSNMSTIERLYKRMGMNTIIIETHSNTKTKTKRSELLAWFIK